MKLYFLFILILVQLNIIANTKQNEIWSLGEKDNSSEEFALYKQGKENFIHAGFASPDWYFYAGNDSASDFPYIIPGPTANWAGYSYWAGQTHIRIPIIIKLDNVESKSKYRFNLNLLEVDYEQNMYLRLDVNGTNYDVSLSKESKNINVDVQPGIFKDGVNIIYIQLCNGRSVTLDAMSLLGPSSTKLLEIGSKPIVSVKMAEYNLLNDKCRTNPLLLDVISKYSTELKIVINDEIIYKSIESGKHIYELFTGEVKGNKNISVKVYSANDIVWSGKLKKAKKKIRETIDYVDIFSGTSGSRWMIGPGPWMPMSMVKLMPDNEDLHWKAGYEYNIENIMGFSHIHEWTMAGLLFMPTNGVLKINPGSEKLPESGYRSRINKKTERARVGYYGVYLDDYNIDAEITATTRASMQKYTFNRKDSARVLIDFFFPAEYRWSLEDLYVRKVSDNEIEGWTLNDCRSSGYHGIQRYKLHFVVQFNRNFTDMNGWVNDSIFNDISLLRSKENKSKSSFEVKNDVKDRLDAGIFMNFKLKGNEVVMARTGISLVSIENARLNLEEEISKPFDWNFTKVENYQRAVWKDLFGTVKIYTDDVLLKKKFYTNLYRALSARNTWNDVNGEWLDMNGNVAQIGIKGKNVYGGDSAWGMHWTLGPFYNLLYPDIMSNWIYTYEQSYRIGGWLPNGNPGMKYFRVMVGSPAVPLIVSGFQHGIRDFDTELMYDAIKHQQTAKMENYPTGGQVGNESYPDYIVKGYVPFYKNEDLKFDSPYFMSFPSNTMEYAFQDYCAAQYFKSFNNTQDYDEFMKRSNNWKNLFDINIKYIRPKYPNGNWVEGSNPYRYPGFCEGNSWQYTWYVPHDVKGLIGMMGEDTFIERLNAGFEASEKVNFNALGDRMSDYPVNHGNETNMQASYLFSFTNKPWLTQKWNRAIQEKYYGLGPRDAYPGDEDQGQMSSWYVLSSIGLFTMDGGCSEDPKWLFGSPRFDRVEIQLDERYYSGNKLIIEAENVSKTNCYIQFVSFNGVPLSKNYIEWSKLKEGGKLHFVMGNVPNMTNKYEKK